MPANPYTEMCADGCGSLPDDPSPKRAAPARLCLEGLCLRHIVLDFQPWLHLELDGKILTETTTLDRWSDRLTIQAYSASGHAYRCEGRLSGADVRLWVGWSKQAHAPEVVESPGDQIWPCEAVGDSTWALGFVASVDPVALDEGLAQAYLALPKRRADDDDDMAAWLASQGLIPRGTVLWRKLPGGRAVDGDALVVRRVSFEGLFSVAPDGRRSCSPWCVFDHEWTGPLTAHWRGAVVGEAARRLCASWNVNPGGQMVVDSQGKLSATVPVEGTCTPSWTGDHLVKRVSFKAPRLLDPTPPRDPKLPRSVKVPWDLPARVQPSARDVPPQAQATVATIGSWIATTEPNLFLRAKAVHDWVATHIAYDVEAYRTRKFPPQDAEHVFATQTGVCAGYANLMVALGSAAGLEFRYLTGWVRSAHGLESHAWNAVRVERQWYLLDATWDAGSVGDAGFTASYGTDWLFVRPEIFLATHHPTEEAWQLVPTVESDAEFRGRK